ncbi:hypothetical protein HDU98_005636, partial [Podochytrium sp. JEL0797]
MSALVLVLLIRLDGEICDLQQDELLAFIDMCDLPRDFRMLLGRVIVWAARVEVELFVARIPPPVYLQTLTATDTLNMRSDLLACSGISAATQEGTRATILEGMKAMHAANPSGPPVLGLVSDGGNVLVLDKPFEDVVESRPRVKATKRTNSTALKNLKKALERVKANDEVDTDTGELVGLGEAVVAYNQAIGRNEGGFPDEQELVTDDGLEMLEAAKFDDLGTIIFGLLLEEYSKLAPNLRQHPSLEPALALVREANNKRGIPQTTVYSVLRICCAYLGMEDHLFLSCHAKFGAEELAEKVAEKEIITRRIHKN